MAFEKGHNPLAGDKAECTTADRSIDTPGCRGQTVSCVSNLVSNSNTFIFYHLVAALFSRFFNASASTQTRRQDRIHATEDNTQRVLQWDG